MSKRAGNPRRVFRDPSTGGWTAHVFHSKYGNVIASGATKSESLRELRERLKRIKTAGTWRVNPSLYDLIRHGDRVTIVDRFGKQRTGRAVMLGPAGWVLNMGGPHGTPAIASPQNITRVSPRKNPLPRARIRETLRKAFSLSGPELERAVQTGYIAGGGKLTPKKIRELRRLYPNPAELLVSANPPRHLQVGELVTFHGYDGKDYQAKVVEIRRGVAVIKYPVPGYREDVTAYVNRKDWKRRFNPAMELVVMGANPGNPYSNKDQVMRLAQEKANEYGRTIYVGKYRGVEHYTFRYDSPYTGAMEIDNVKTIHPRSANPPGVHAAAPGVTAEAHEAGNNPPSAADIFEGFTGRESEWVTVTDEPHIPRGDYAQLGDLLNLYVKPVGGGQVLELRFRNSKPIIVCDRSARQIYFVGGDQDIDGMLDRFGAVGISDGRFRLGEGVRIDYRARKDHVADPDEDKWKHYFGEENGAKPKVLFDSRHKRLLLDGGDYRIDGAWIRN